MHVVAEQLLGLREPPLGDRAPQPAPQHQVGEHDVARARHALPDRRADGRRGERERIPSGTEIASSAAWPGGTTVQTASAGRTTTNAVAITTCGSHRSMPGARRLWATRTAIQIGIGSCAANLDRMAPLWPDSDFVFDAQGRRSSIASAAASSIVAPCAGRAARGAARAGRSPTTAGRRRGRARAPRRARAAPSPPAPPPATSTAIAFGSCGLSASRRSSSGLPGASASDASAPRGGGPRPPRRRRAGRARRAPARRGRGRRRWPGR